MNKKIILSISLIVLVGLAIFVSATMTVINENNNVKQYSVELQVTKGWNLIASGFTFASDLNYLDESGDIKKENIKAVYVYANKLNDYISSYPKYDERLYSANNYFKGDEKDIIGQANWIYVDKSGTLKYKTKAIKTINSTKLFSGWNFVSITPDMKGISFNDFKGDCNIIKYCGWQFQKWQCVDWDSLTRDMIESGKVADTDSDIGGGFVIKVSDDCKLGTSSGGNISSVPNLP